MRPTTYFVITFLTLTSLLLSQTTIHAVPVNLISHNSTSGVTANTTEKTLTLTWQSPKGQTALILNTTPNTHLIKAITITPKNVQPATVLRNATPITVLTVGQRDLKKRNGWTIFFDRTSHKPSTTKPLTLNLKSITVKSIGNRCLVDVDTLNGNNFTGKLRFTLYAGCDLIHIQAIVSTKQNARAILYHAGLTTNLTDKSITYIGLDDQFHSTPASTNPAKSAKVRFRTIALKTKFGAIAIFPPPHRFFYPLDEAYNLAFTWHGSKFMKQIPTFALGIRQHLQGDRRWVPWFNAPPNTQQQLGLFLLPSTKPIADLFQRVKAYTHNDTFPPIPGHTTFSSHYHIEHVTKVLDHRAKSNSPNLPAHLTNPQFINVFKKAGVRIVHLAEFHNHLGRVRRNPDKTFPLLKTLHDECARLSDKDLLLLPGEEPNVHLGGHWISFFPKPVMWSLGRPKNKPFTEIHPKYGRVYHVGSSADVLKLFQREKGLMWAAHPRIKGSTSYPDRYRNKPFFKSDRYLGGAWKAMPADLSKPRLGWRVLNLLNDTSNWNARKYILGEVDIFKVDNTTEFYAHVNINYLRLSKIPRYKDGWALVLHALRAGAFFISTGEVLLPQFTVGQKQSGQTLKLNPTGQTTLEAKLTWTFPMAFAEIITGDGQKTYRQRIPLTNTTAFRSKTIKIPLKLKGKKWIRLEAWDIAANGVISQPIWLE